MRNLGQIREAIGDPQEVVLSRNEAAEFLVFLGTGTAVKFKDIIIDFDTLNAYAKAAFKALGRKPTEEIKQLIVRKIQYAKTIFQREGKEISYPRAKMIIDNLIRSEPNRFRDDTHTRDNIYRIRELFNFAAAKVARQMEEETGESHQYIVENVCRIIETHYPLNGRNGNGANT